MKRSETMTNFKTIGEYDILRMAYGELTSKWLREIERIEEFTRNDNRPSTTRVAEIKRDRYHAQMEEIGARMKELESGR